MLPASLPPCPGALFIALWQMVASWLPAERTAADGYAPDLSREVEKALENADGKAAFEAACTFLPKAVPANREERGLILEVMRGIDRKFTSIHPRHILASHSLGKREKQTPWLHALNINRGSSGIYASFGNSCLIARGPLRLSARPENASSGDDLADRFCALTVVNQQEKLQETPIQVTMSNFGTSLRSGFRPASAPGKEKITLIPVVEEAHEIEAQPAHAPRKSYVDFCLHSSVDPARRILDALREAGATDLALAPEFVVSEDACDSLAQSMKRTAGSHKFRILVAGSGLTKDETEGQKWNECRVLNATGQPLWSQRKIWPACMTATRAGQYGLKNTGPTQDVFENTASGNTLHIADVQDLGRCVVLICQDLESMPLASQVIARYQPDWVFVPILDTRVNAGRWCHQKAYALSASAHTRFVIVSSTALGAKLKESPLTCGAVIGPRASVDELKVTRSFLTIEAATQNSARFGQIVWDECQWQQTKMISE